MHSHHARCMLTMTRCMLTLPGWILAKSAYICTMALCIAHYSKMHSQYSNMHSHHARCMLTMTRCSPCQDGFSLSQHTSAPWQDASHTIARYAFSMLAICILTMPDACSLVTRCMLTLPGWILSESAYICTMARCIPHYSKIHSQYSNMHSHHARCILTMTR